MTEPPKQELVVYEDDSIIVALVEHPLAEGHIYVTPKHKCTIFEEMHDYEVGSIFAAINKISVSLFEALQAQGTNVLIQNGTGAGQTETQLRIQIIPRRQHDNLHLEWNPNPLTEEQMSTIELKLKEQMDQVGIFEKEKKKPVEIPAAKHVEVIGEQDYLMKQLRRIP